MRENRDGIVDYDDASRIVVRAMTKTATADEVGVDIYNLDQIHALEPNTSMTQRPAGACRRHKVKGDVVADGAWYRLGELALGQNILIAFMPWNGYNFEDSILISERVIDEDALHLDSHRGAVGVARDTKLGTEDITRDIQTSETQLGISTSGIICIGAEVKPVTCWSEK